MSKDWKLVQNSADPEQVREAGKSEHRTDLKYKENLRAVLDTPHGRRFLWVHLLRCGLYRMSFGKDGAEAVAFREGLRCAALQLVDEIRGVDEAFWVTMQKEAMEEEPKHE